MQGKNLSDASQAVLTISLTRDQLRNMSESGLLHCALLIYSWHNPDDDEREVICQLIRKTAPFLCKALAGTCFIGGEAWALIEKAIGHDIYEEWRNVKKGKP